MTPVDAAFVAARRLGREWGCPRPLEFVGAAWEGASRAHAAGVRGGLLLVAACRAVIDQLRSEGGRRGGRVHAVRHAGRLPAGLAAPEPAPDVDPVLSLWCRTRDARAGMTPRQRVRLALWLVEGLTFAQVADAVGCSLTEVSQDVSRALAGVPGAAEATASLARSRRNLSHYRGAGA